MRSLHSVTLGAALASLSSLVLASPIQISPNAPTVVRNVLLKRTDPDTAGDLVEPQVSEVEQGFKDAIEHCSYVVGTNDQTVDPILAKYFNSGDKDTVIKVFNQIMGNPADPDNPDPTGNSLLGSILVQKADTSNLCGGQTLAYMGDPGTDNPFIVVCDILFQHKAIGDTTCDSLGDNVSYKMLTIGGTLIHEYT